MKIENTLKNKAKFFAQYWGQECLCTKRGKGTYKMGNWQLFDEDYILLIPLSQITDENAVEVAKLQGYDPSNMYPLNIHFDLEDEFMVCLQCSHHDN